MVLTFFHKSALLLSGLQFIVCIICACICFRTCLDQYKRSSPYTMGDHIEPSDVFWCVVIYCVIVPFLLMTPMYALAYYLRWVMS